MSDFNVYVNSDGRIRSRPTSGGVHFLRNVPGSFYRMFQANLGSLRQPDDAPTKSSALALQ